MNDDTHSTHPSAPQPTPNRSGRRRPPLIEGDPAREVEAQRDAPGGAPGDAPAPSPAEPLDAKSDAPASDAPASDAPASDAPKIGEAATKSPGPGGSGPGETAPPPLDDASLRVGQDAGEPAGPTPPPSRTGVLARPAGVGTVLGASFASAALAAILVYAVTPSSGGGDGAWPGALEARISAVERLARDASRRAGEASDSVRKLAEARPQPTPAGQSTGADALGSLERRLAALEKASQAPQTQPAAPAAVEQRLAALEKAVAAPKAIDRATETRVAAVPPAPPVDLGPLRQQIGALDERLKSFEGQLASVAKESPAVAGRVDALAQAAQASDGRLKAAEERLQPLGARVEEARSQAEADRKRTEAFAMRSVDAARLALAQSVVGAIQAGTPFPAQVEALGRLDVPAERLAPLKETASAGVATPAELARAFAGIEARVSAREAPGANASIVDRLASSASGLVRVRPAGEPTGDAPADAAARIRIALERSDVAGALQAWDKLPEAGKAASSEWVARARARLAAEEAARAILAESSQRLGRI